MSRFPTVTVAALALLAACSADREPVAGSYVSTRLQVEFREQGREVTGTFRLGERSFAAKGQRDGSAITGAFADARGHRFPFTAEQTGAGLRIETGGTTYELARATPKNPLAAPDAGKPANPLAGSQSTRVTTETPVARPQGPKLGKRHKHPAGVYFDYPESWQANDVSEGAVSLVPGDVHRVDGEQAELCLLIGEDAQGAKRPDHATVLAMVRTFAKTTFPYLEEKGEPRRFEVGGEPALEIRFGGKAPAFEVAATMQFRLVGGYVLGAFTLAEATRFEARHEVAAAVFASIGYEKPAADARLVGHWRYQKTYMSGSFSSITVRNLVLRADGTCAEGGRLMAGMEHQDGSGDPTGWSHGESGGNGADSTGRWRTQGRDIILTWSNGTSERWDVYTEGSSMLWKSGGTKKLWKRTR